MDSLLLFRYVKECLALLDDLLKLFIRNTDVLEVQEANLHEGVPELGQERRLGSRVLGRGEIQDWNRRERHDVDVVRVGTFEIAWALPSVRMVSFM